MCTGPRVLHISPQDECGGSRVPASLRRMDVHLTSSGVKPGAQWRRVTRGAHHHVEALDQDLATLRAWSAVLPERAAFTHVTGAQLLGLWLPPLPGGIPTTVQVSGRMTTAPQRAGLRVIRCVAREPHVQAHGLRVAPVGEVILSLCRDLGPLDALVVVDSALHRGLTTAAELERTARQRRRGAPLLRALLPLADARSESPWETILRELHRCVRAPVTPQHEVRDANGRFVARGDLRIDGTRVLHEYDGHHHLSVDRQRADLRRSRALTAAGWARRGYTSDDLLHRPASVLRDVDATLGRTYDPSRLAAWTDLLHDSARTPSGRALLRRRLVPAPSPAQVSS